jgi:hypothetical protein
VLRVTVRFGSKANLRRGDKCPLRAITGNQRHIGARITAMKILRESQEGIPNAGRSNKGARKVWQPAHLADQQVGTACISLAMQSLERGFQGIGMKPTWEKIRDALKINDFLGTDLQIMLQQLGWKIYSSLFLSGGSLEALSHRGL